MSFCCFPVSLSLQSQPTGYSGNSQITNRGENPPNVTLDHVVEDLLSFFNESESFKKAKKEIEKQCEMEHGQNCWPPDDIKLAWEKTQTMNIKLRRRRHWARVIMLQVLRTSLHYDGFNRIEVQSDPKEVGTSPILSDVAKETTLSEPEQGPSEIPSTSEKRDKMATTEKRNDDSNTKVTIKKEECLELLDQSLAELCVSNKENVMFGRQKTKIVENPAGGTSQINAELRTAEEESEDINQDQNKKRKCSDVIYKMDRLEKDEFGSWVRGGSNQCNSQTVYIRIPLSVMSGNESTCQPKTVDNVNPTYKLIDRVPYLTEIRKKKSYAMLYDNRTRNAVWVYEILNMSTIRKDGVHTEKKDFKVDNSIHPFYQAPMSNNPMQNYDRGHLAAAANHKWCQEAYEDTYLISNMTRQHLNLNGVHWKTLEEKCRSDIRHKQSRFRNIHVYSGPLYLPIGEKSVVEIKMVSDKAVPTHFFKLIIKETWDGTVELECYEFLNGENLLDISAYKKPIDYIERVTGLIFTESSYDQGGTDSMKTVEWEGTNTFDVKVNQRSE